MLIDEKRVTNNNSMANFVSNILGDSGSTGELDKGVYQVSHFGSTDFLSGYEHYPELSIGSYGVCDDPSQIFDLCPEIKDSKDRKFVITLTMVRKDQQPSQGGWRWHKWGEYIGTQGPEYEYLYEEDNIDQVYCFHIYEKLQEGV